jgi:hypothetical protein
MDDVTLLASVSFSRICNGHYTYSSYIFKSAQYLAVSPELESDWGPVLVPSHLVLSKSALGRQSSIQGRCPLKGTT